MQRKNIDELFREKLSDFKQAPDNKVWRAIDASLDKRKKRRVIPIWWSLSGIAAALLIGLLIFNPFKEEQTTNEILVDTDNAPTTIDDIQPNTKNEVFIDSITTHSNAIVEQSITNKESVNDSESSVLNTENQNSTSTVLSDKTNYKKAQTTNNFAKNNTIDQQTKGSSQETLITKNISKAGFDKNKTENPLNEDLNSSEAMAINSRESFKSLNTDNLKEEHAVTANTPIEETPETVEPNKKSIFEEIEHQEKLKKEKVATNRWSAGPNVAPVYFNALGEGSPVNSIFTPNTKSGNINMSYGVTVAYAVTKKLTIRSGINKVDYGYDTEDVAFSSSSSLASQNGQLSSIDYAETSNTLTIASNIVSSEKYTTTNLAQDVTAKSPTRDGFMSQQFGYLELPLELNYALLDKKFGVNIIGGVSSLFLIDNAVSLTSGDLTTEIGEANNINDLNFSANMGLGLNYNFSQKVRFNVEPIFKYQLNTFSDVNGTFRPYSVGVYSGLTFKF
jgi:hypothetical protein